jgi:hypothetical protein
MDHSEGDAGVGPTVVEALLRELARFGPDDPLQQVLLRVADLYRDGYTAPGDWVEKLRKASRESAWEECLNQAQLAGEWAECFRLASGVPCSEEAAGGKRARGLIARTAAHAAEAGLLTQAAANGCPALVQGGARR